MSHDPIDKKNVRMPPPSPNHSRSTDLLHRIQNISAGLLHGSPTRPRGNGGANKAQAPAGGVSAHKRNGTTIGSFACLKYSSTRSSSFHGERFLFWFWSTCWYFSKKVDVAWLYDLVTDAATSRVLGINPPRKSTSKSSKTSKSSLANQPTQSSQANQQNQPKNLPVALSFFGAYYGMINLPTP